MVLSEKTLYSVGRRWVYVFNRRKAKKEIPVIPSLSWYFAWLSSRRASQPKMLLAVRTTRTSAGLQIRPSSQDFHFGPGTVTVSTRAAPNTTSTLHMTSAGRRQGSSIRSQTLIERAERRSGRHCSLRNLLEPKTVDPRLKLIFPCWSRIRSNASAAATNSPYRSGAYQRLVSPAITGQNFFDIVSYLPMPLSPPRASYVNSILNG